MAAWVRSFPSVALLASLLAPPAALADVNSATPTPGARPVALGQTTTLSLVWNVLRDAAGNCGNTVSSSQGLIRADSVNGPVMLTVPTTLSQTRLCTGTPAQFTFTESLFIPADVVQRAQRQGASSLFFVRVFGDVVGASAIGSVVLPITSSAAAGFSISREALQFDNGAPVRVLARREPLQAFAEIDYSGSGLLQAVWELAGPTSTTGEPIFRPLSQVREFVAPTGEKKVLKSPPLPTDAIGLYLVRLRITDPATSFEAPVIRYFVGDGRPGRELPPQPLTTYSPPPSAVLAGDTSFTWAPIAGAKAYQLQIYRLARDSGAALPSLSGDDGADPREIARALARPPVTGMLVAGKQTSTALSTAARMHLVPGQVYLWRVQAIGTDGAIIGESAPRELRTP
jgi:hypothetical protein